MKQEGKPPRKTINYKKEILNMLLIEKVFYAKTFSVIRSLEELIILLGELL